VAADFGSKYLDKVNHPSAHPGNMFIDHLISIQFRQHVIVSCQASRLSLNN
jgi:hypothetical protein